MIQTQQNTFVLFTLFKLTLDERKTLTKISTRKPLTTVPQTSARFGHEGTRKPAKSIWQNRNDGKFQDWFRIKLYIIFWYKNFTLFLLYALVLEM